MTPRQLAAIAHTCRLPEQTVHPRFRSYHPGFSTILTFNSGFE